MAQFAGAARCRPMPGGLLWNCVPFQDRPHFESGQGRQSEQRPRLAPNAAIRRRAGRRLGNAATCPPIGTLDEGSGLADIQLVNAPAMKAAGSKMFKCRDPQAARQHLKTDREHQDQAAPEQDLICRHQPHRFPDKTDTGFWLGLASACTAERCGTSKEPPSWESALWLACCATCAPRPAGARAGTRAPAGSGRQDLGLLALELPGGDDSPVAEVGQLGQLVRRAGR